MRDSLEALFGRRTIKLLLLATLALIIPLFVPHSMLDDGAQNSFEAITLVIRGTLLVVGGFLVLGAIASGLLDLRSRQISARAADDSGDPSEGKVIGGELIIGLEVARHAIRYGAVRFSRESNAKQATLATVRMEELLRTGEIGITPGSSRVELYRKLVAAVREVLASVDAGKAGAAGIAGIAVSTPSWIDVRTKSLASPVGPFPVHEPLVANLARYLWEEERNLVHHAFHPKLADRNELESRIFLDTDSRSAIRYDHHERLKQKTAFRNYACVLVLEGVGAGLVLGGEIYYGSHSSEGEIGHMTVHLSSEFRVPGSREAVAVAACDCQLPGLHWETLAGVNALSAIAASIDPARYRTVTLAYEARPTGHDLIDAARAIREGTTIEILPNELAMAINSDAAGFRAYFTDVFRAYARIITLGVANMVNLLDLDHVVIGGPIMQDLDHVAFRDEVRKFWNEYVLRGQGVGHSYRSLEQIWQGATLLFYDSSYLRKMS